MKLQKLKSWHRLAEAAKYLSDASSEQLTSHDILHFIVEGLLTPAISLINHPARQVEPSGYPNAFLQDAQTPDYGERINAACLWKTKSTEVHFLKGIYILDTRATPTQDYLRALLASEKAEHSDPFCTLVVANDEGSYFQLLVRKTKGEPMKIVRNDNEIELNVFYAGIKGYDPKVIDIGLEDIVVTQREIERFIKVNLWKLDEKLEQTACISPMKSSVDKESSAQILPSFNVLHLREKDEDDDNKQIPGTLPSNAIGRLAVKAAWEIESISLRRAPAPMVMKLLQKWADEGAEPSTLLKSDEAKHGVIWLTDKRLSKLYTFKACLQTLKKWNDSRQQLDRS